MILGDPIIFGGSGGPSSSDAILIVTVPTGSTVTATKGGVTLTPTMWVKAADSTLDCAMFSIKASQFDSTTPWIVTATNGTDTTSGDVLITTNKEYEVVLSYKLVIISPSIMSLSTLQGNTRFANDAQYSKITQEDNYFVYNATGATSRGWQWKTLVDCANYNYLVIRGYKNGSNEVHFGFGDSLTASVTSLNNIADGTLSTTSLDITTLDISTKNGSYYFGIYTRAVCSVYVQEIYLANTP